MLPEYIRQRLPLERLADELRRERFAHNRTVGRLKKTLKRLSVRDGTGHTSTRICLACQDVPLGLNPVAYRSECPHNWLPDAIREHERLEQRWDSFLRQLANGAVDTTPPMPELSEGAIITCSDRKCGRCHGCIANGVEPPNAAQEAQG